MDGKKENGMKQISEILLSTHWAADGGRVGHRIIFFCPGCEDLHSLEVDPRNKPHWTWNGNVDKPSLQPSARHFVTDPETHQEETTCHYFVTDGVIDFCGDSPHKLTGQKVPIPPLPKEWCQP